MKKLLLILPLLLMSACTTETVRQGQVDYEYDKVHIYEIGCVPKAHCRTVWLRAGYAGTAIIEYADPDGNLFVTSSFALVKGRCPVCEG